MIICLSRFEMSSFVSLSVSLSVRYQKLPPLRPCQNAQHNASQGGYAKAFNEHGPAVHIGHGAQAVGGDADADLFLFLLTGRHIFGKDPEDGGPGHGLGGSVETPCQYHGLGGVRGQPCW